jgi:phosphate starvation-inducible protein PhoH
MRSQQSERRTGRSNRSRREGRNDRRTTREQPENVIQMNDVAARREGPDKKTWNEHDLRHIQALTENQDVALQAWFASDEGHLALLGSAGSGKTLLASYFASVAYTRREQRRIVVIRAGVPKRDPGALPGTLEQKQAKYESPYIACFHQLFGKALTYQNMKDAGVIEFHTTSFIRGMTFDDSIIIVEECQNMDFDELDSVLTRPGTNSRVILTGDTLRQCDLKHFETSGVQILEEVAHELEGMTLVQFTPEDCVRSGFAKSWLLATERFFTKARAQARNERR